MALKLHTANFTEKYEQLSMNYEQLRLMVMNMTGQNGDTCAPLFGRITTSLLLLQLRHCANLIFFLKHIQFVMNIILFYFFVFYV